MSSNMLRSACLVFGVLVGSAAGMEEFFKKYAYTKVMSHCLGENVYHHYLVSVAEAKAYCRGQRRHSYASPTFQNGIRDMSSSPNTPNFDSQRPFEVRNTRPSFHKPSFSDPRESSYDSYRPSYGRPLTPPPVQEGNTGIHQNLVGDNRQIFDSTHLNLAVEKVSTFVSNLTCVLQTINLIDQEIDIQYESVLEYYRQIQIHDELRDDLLRGIQFCREFVSCLPSEKLAVIPLKMKNVFAYMKCEKKMRLAACFKHDLRNNLHLFDINAIPSSGNRNANLEKLMAILIGAESTDELKLF